MAHGKDIYIALSLAVGHRGAGRLTKLPKELIFTTIFPPPLFSTQESQIWRQNNSFPGWSMSKQCGVITILSLVDIVEVDVPHILVVSPPFPQC